MDKNEFIRKMAVKLVGLAMQRSGMAICILDAHASPPGLPFFGPIMCQLDRKHGYKQAAVVLSERVSATSVTVYIRSVVWQRRKGKAWNWLSNGQANRNAQGTFWGDTLEYVLNDEELAEYNAIVYEGRFREMLLNGNFGDALELQALHAKDTQPITFTPWKPQEGEPIFMNLPRGSDQHISAIARALCVYPIQQVRWQRGHERPGVHGYSGDGHYVSFGNDDTKALREYVKNERQRRGFEENAIVS